MDKKIINNLKDLNKLNRERIFWLRISAFVIFLVFVTVLNWDYLLQSNIVWLIGVIGLMITVMWWYWTMSIIRKIIGFKTVETELLNDLIVDIKYIKKNIIENRDQNS